MCKIQTYKLSWLKHNKRIQKEIKTIMTPLYKIGDMYCRRSGSTVVILAPSNVQAKYLHWLILCARVIFPQLKKVNIFEFN